MAYPEFRHQLDSILRSKNPQTVRQFLVEQGQWDESFSGDVEHAMWMMIAGSPTLQELHTEAQDWLRRHGYQAEAAMLREQTKAPSRTRSTPTRAKRAVRPEKPSARNKRPGGRAPGHPGTKPVP